MLNNFEFICHSRVQIRVSYLELHVFQAMCRNFLSDPELAYTEGRKSPFDVFLFATYCCLRRIDLMISKKIQNKPVLKTETNITLQSQDLVWIHTFLDAYQVYTQEYLPVEILHFKMKINQKYLNFCN